MEDRSWKIGLQSDPGGRVGEPAFDLLDVAEQDRCAVRPAAVAGDARRVGAGESVKVIQSRMGHAFAMVTLDVYGHMFPDSDDRTRAAVDAYLGNPAGSVRTVNASGQVGAAASDYLEKA